jgi:hypothetical protein
VGTTMEIQVIRRLGKKPKDQRFTADFRGP